MGVPRYPFPASRVSCVVKQKQSGKGTHVVLVDVVVRFHLVIHRSFVRGHLALHRGRHVPRPLSRRGSRLGRVREGLRALALGAVPVARRERTPKPRAMRALRAKGAFSTFGSPAKIESEISVSSTWNFCGFAERAKFAIFPRIFCAVQDGRALRPGAPKGKRARSKLDPVKLETEIAKRPALRFFGFPRSTSANATNEFPSLRDTPRRASWIFRRATRTSAAVAGNAVGV